MKLKVIRNRFLEDRTIGQLYINEDFFCFTLEDVIREDPDPSTPQNEAKVYAETAIPEGRYKVSLVTSPKFGENTIYLHDVPGYTGILIHGGYGPANTAGCILVAYKLTKDNFTNYSTSKPCLQDLKEKVKQATKDGEKVEIDVVSM